MDSQPKSSGLVLGRQPLGAILHSSNEPGELSQWFCHDDSHDDSTINIVVVIIIIIIYGSSVEWTTHHVVVQLLQGLECYKYTQTTAYDIR